MTEQTRHFRIRYTKLGGHIHCRVFSAPHPTSTYAKLGDITLDEGDWDNRDRLFSGYAEFMPDD